MKPNFYSSEASAYDYLAARWPRAVWQSVLEQAMRDIVEGPRRREERAMSFDEWTAYSTAVRRAAEDWVADTSNEPRRFEWVCEQLGLAPSAVRVEIERRKHPCH